MLNMKANNADPNLKIPLELLLHCNYIDSALKAPVNIIKTAINLNALYI